MEKEEEVIRILSNFTNKKEEEITFKEMQALVTLMLSINEKIGGNQ